MSALDQLLVQVEKHHFGRKHAKLFGHAVVELVQLYATITSARTVIENAAIMRDDTLAKKWLEAHPEAKK